MSRARPPSSPAGQLHVAEVAALLQVSLKTLRRWDRDGSLPALRDARSGHRVYGRGAVAAFAARRRGHVLPLPPARAVVLDEVGRALEEHGALVLAGPPGAGKTWLAELVAHGYRHVLRVDDVDAAESLPPVPDVRLVIVEAVTLARVQESSSKLERSRSTHRAHYLICARVGASALRGIPHVALGSLAPSDSAAMLAELAGRPLSPAWTAPLVAALEGHPPWLRRAGAAIAAGTFADPLALADAIRASPDAHATAALEETPGALARTLRALSLSPRALTLEMAAQMLGAETDAAHRDLDELEARALLVREGAFHRVPEPLRLAALASFESAERRLHQARADHLLVTQLERRRGHVSAEDVDVLLDVVERGAGSALAERAVRAIPGWAVGARHAARLVELGAPDVVPRLGVEVALARGELEVALARARAASGLEHELRLREAFVLRRLGRLVEAEEVLGRALAAGPPRDLRARMSNELGAVLYLRGHVGASVRVLLEAEETAVDLGLSLLRGAISTNLANALADLGELHAASRAASRAQALATDERSRVIAAANLARLQIDTGELDGARETLDALDHGHPSLEAGLCSFLLRLRGWLEAEQGDADAATSSFARSTATALGAGERHAARRAELEQAIAMMAARPALSASILSRLEVEAARDGAAAEDLALVRALGAALAGAPCPAPGSIEGRSVATVDSVTAALAGLAAPGATARDRIAHLRIASDRAMTRAVVRFLRARCPSSLSVLALDVQGREALLGATRLDLLRKRAVAPVLRALLAAWPGGLDAELLLARGWPDERLSLARAGHRVHGAIAALRRLGVPIAHAAKEYRLDVDTALEYDLDAMRGGFA